jgi:predicted RNA-binding protein (virulence factor B family)
MGKSTLEELKKEFNLAKKHFKKAIELAKKNLVVGEIHFAGSEKKSRARKVKVAPEPEGKDLA